MLGRKRSIRFKIFLILLVPITSLLAIWGFAASITVGEGLELLRIETVSQNVITPARALTSALQQERLQSLRALSSGKDTDYKTLQQYREATNDARTTLERQAFAEDVQEDLTPAMRQRLAQLQERLDRLNDVRSRVDGGDITRLQALESYSAIVEPLDQLYDKLQLSPNPALLEQTKAIGLLNRSREMISRQAALIAGVVAAGRMTEQEHALFGELAIIRKSLYEMAFNQLDAELRAPYTAYRYSIPYGTYEATEERIAKNVPTGRRLPPDSENWVELIQSAALAFDQLGGASTITLRDRALPLAQQALLRIIVTTGLGLVAVVVSLLVFLRVGRRFAAELVALKNDALHLARAELPDVVARLRRGEEVQITEPRRAAADARHGTEEIVAVGEALDSVHRTAIEAAVGQAQLRKGVSKVFVNLARRSQSLLHRQLAMLQSMEQRVESPQLLEELFKLDHLTTRMRRHAEGLIILSGQPPGRGWRNPIPMFDVVRAAAEEVEDYPRVEIRVPHGQSLTGPAVTDVVHLLAELVENATIFSPPNTPVHIRGESVASGFVLEIEDRGLGINAEDLAVLNQRLADPPEFDLADSDRLGLFVVARLAARHNIRVSLRGSPYGGTTAIVLIPQELVVETTSEDTSFTAVAGLLRGSRTANGTTPGGLPIRSRPTRSARWSHGPRDDDTVNGAAHGTAAPVVDGNEESPRDLMTSFGNGWQRAHQEEGNAS